MEKKIIENGAQKLYKYMRAYKPSVFESEIGQRLPPEYRKFYKEWKEDPPKPVNYIPETRRWVRDEKTFEIKRYENVPLPPFKSPELEQIFTGGEEIILGFKKKEKKFARRVPKFWIPHIFSSVVYSEILDKYISVLMTKRVVRLIHEHEGFENYLFQNKACDLKTLVALKLKRHLFFKLSDQDLPYDKEKNQKIFEKYEKYLIPRNEIEWYGLSFIEACEKQEKIEKELKEQSKVPLKHILRMRLINELQQEKDYA